MKRRTAALAVRVTLETRDRARALVAGLRGTDAAIEGGVSGLVEQALIREVARLERLYNNGEVYPDVEALPRGPGV